MAGSPWGRVRVAAAPRGPIERVGGVDLPGAGCYHLPAICIPMAALCADEPHPSAAPRAFGATTLRNPHRDPGGLPHMSGHTSGFKRLPLLVLSLALATTPARAQVAGKVWEGSAGLGYVHYDSRDHLRDSGMLTA